MPRERRNLRDKYQMWLDSNPDLYADLCMRENEFDLYCNVCDRFINSSTKYKVTRHVSSHFSNRVENSNFFYELTEAFVAADIPFEKLSHPILKKFLEKYTDQKIPSPTTLRGTYVTEVYEDVVKKIREDVYNNYIYFMVDEATDACGRLVANFIIGALKSDGSSNNHLVASRILEKNNPERVVSFVTECFDCLWPGIDDYANKVLVMLTNGSTYMLKAADILSQKYSSMVHFTCAVHALNSIAETIGHSFPLVNNLISSVKKVFIKAPTRRAIFKELLPDVPMPPAPVAGRSSSWLEAVAYYNEYFDDVKHVISTFDMKESNSIKISQDLLEEESVREDIRYINNNFSMLLTAMAKLEAKGLSLKEQFTIINDVRTRISSNDRDLAYAAIKEEMLNVFANNPGYSVLEEICNYFDGTYQELPPSILKYKTCINDFSYCPLTMFDIERSFLLLKSILSDRRRTLSETNLEKLIVINFEHQNVQMKSETNR